MDIVLGARACSGAPKLRIAEIRTQSVWSGSSQLHESVAGNLEQA